MHHVATKGAYGSFLASGNYKRDRCLVCIDFTSELADVSVGDVFQRREENPRWGAALVRTEIGQHLVEGATSKGYLEIKAHDPQLIPASGYGWEASKHANVARLLERRQHGWPTPDFDCPLEIEPLPRQVASSTQ
jgi:coenzyme F420 hydrogenase subunit beta